MHGDIQGVPDSDQGLVDGSLSVSFRTHPLGFDLVGHEEASSGYTLKDYLTVLLRFQSKQIEEFGEIRIPYVFHAGETLGDGSVVDDNLYDALLLGTKRIGHGYSLYKHPELMRICREEGVLVESCPISNEVLRLTGGIGKWVKSSRYKDTH